VPDRKPPVFGVRHCRFPAFHGFIFFAKEAECFFFALILTNISNNADFQTLSSLPSFAGG